MADPGQPPFAELNAVKEAKAGGLLVRKKEVLGASGTGGFVLPDAQRRHMNQVAGIRRSSFGRNTVTGKRNEKNVG